MGSLCGESPPNVASSLCNNGSALARKSSVSCNLAPAAAASSSSSNPQMLHFENPQLQSNASIFFTNFSSKFMSPLQDALVTACSGMLGSGRHVREHLAARPPAFHTCSERERNSFSNLGLLSVKPEVEVDHPSLNQLCSHPLALLSYVPQDAALFFVGAFAGAAGKILTAPLDRIKISMQVHGLKASRATAKRGIGFLETTMKIVKEEGIQGYWKGYFPQVVRIVPYSAVQLFAYEAYKKCFKGEDKELSVPGRLAAGACAGMTSTLITYPLDVLRLRLAVDPASKSMLQVASTMLREEGLTSFYKGLGPSLLGIAPYVALNFCAFDLLKKSLPEEMRKTPAASFVTAFLSASLATSMCYPLDTVRRQLQMKDTPFLTLGDALPGIVARDGVTGLYRGFVPNALKLLPTNSIRLTTFDAAKRLLSASRQEFQRLLRLRREQIANSQL